MARELRKCATCVETYHRCVITWPERTTDDYTPESMLKFQEILSQQDVERLKEALCPEKKPSKLGVVFYEILKYPFVLKRDGELNLLFAKVRNLRRQPCRSLM